MRASREDDAPLEMNDLRSKSATSKTRASTSILGDEREQMADDAAYSGRFSSIDQAIDDAYSASSPYSAEYGASAPEQLAVTLQTHVAVAGPPTRPPPKPKIAKPKRPAFLRKNK